MFSFHSFQWFPWVGLFLSLLPSFKLLMKTSGCGVMVLVNEDMVSSTVFILLSFLVNIMLATLIVSRLIYRRRHSQNVLGEEHGSPYINIMTMCVESSTLVVIFSGIYTALTFVQRQPDAYGALIPFQLLPHICVGGLEHHDIWCTSDIFGLSGYLSAPHRLSRCHGSCYNPNFAAIRASEGPDSVQHSDPQSRRRGVIWTFRYSMTSATRQCLVPQVPSNFSTTFLEGDPGLLAVLWQNLSEPGWLQLHPFH